MIRKLLPIFAFFAISLIFFWQFFLKGFLPIPADTIVGLYHPYRDVFAKEYPNGIPFKNFLITDPVRQQYPWRSLAIDSFKSGNITTWNQYSFSGAPSLANFQSGVLYPLNLIFLVFSFPISWSLIIILQPILAGLFLYYYLRNLKIDELSSFFGGFVFAFSGFFVTWLEWGTILHTALWLPLILLAIDIITLKEKEKLNLLNIKISKDIIWSFVLIFALVSSFFAGHLQIFFYVLVFSTIYGIVRFWKSKNKKRILILFASSLVFSFILVIPQLIPTIKFILLSGREVDQLIWQKEGWFIPWNHLIQFIVPDFFGNPTTLNYWGAWNYGELTGYIGVSSLILAFFAILFRRDKKNLFYFLTFIICLVLVLPNPISKVPFIFNIPFLSTAQPTRLLFLIDFSLSILAAFGLSYLIKYGKLRQILVPIFIVGLFFLSIFGFTYFGQNFGNKVEDFLISRRNIFFPGLVFAISSLLLLIISGVNKKYKNYFVVLIIAICIADLFRFSWKFNTFSDKKYLYPEGKTVKFLQENLGYYRIGTNDPRILAPNFSVIHKLPSVDGYDPLYLNQYAQLISAINRNEPDIKPPYGFNRIIRVENFSSNLVDLLGVKYVLSIDEMNTPGFEKVLEEGSTKIYENTEVLPNTFFASSIVEVKDQDDAIQVMFDKDYDPKFTAVVEEDINIVPSSGSARITKKADNEIVIETENESDGFLVLTDTYYPTWHVKINGIDGKIYRTDFNFRGIVVPKGKNVVIFKNNLL